jgi:hypothetical protein
MLSRQDLLPCLWYLYCQESGWFFVWVAKLTAAMLAIIGTLWLLRISWLSRHPEKVIANLESRLLKNLRAGHAENVLANWNLLCNKIRKGTDSAHPEPAQRGAEAIKLFVGEYFRSDLHNEKLNAAIFRGLASLYAAFITQYPDLATEIVVALRVAAREIVEKNETAFGDIIRQFMLYGLLALREKQYYFAAKILDQIFLLVPKCFNKGLPSQQLSILRAIATLGQSVIKRQDDGLAREIILRLRQSQDIAGRLIHEPIYEMLLKSVRVGSLETLDLLLETSKSILALEEENEVKNTLHIWAEAAKNAIMKQDEVSLSKIITCLVQVTEENLQRETITTACLDELFAVLTFAVRDRDVAEYAYLLFPILELGCLCMRRELKYGLIEGAVNSYQGVLKGLLDRLLHLGAIVTRNGQTSTGSWVTSLYHQWTLVPDNAYRKNALLKFVQLWLLYWVNCQRKTAKKQGGLPEELFHKEGWSQGELARFPSLYIRNQYPR